MGYFNAKKNIIFIFLLAAAAMLLFAGAQTGYAAGKPEKTKLKIGVSTPSVAFLPLYLAEMEKLFQQEGFEQVELLVFKSGTDNVQANISRSIDFSAGAFTEPHTAISKGVKVKVFWGLCNKPVYVWSSRPEIKTIKDAKGKKFAVSAIGAQSHLVTLWVVRKAGLDPEKDIQVIQSGGPMSRMSALKGGAVDVAILSYPGIFVAEREGFNSILKQEDFISGWPNETYYGNISYLKENPETIKAFLRANIKGIELLKKDKQKAMAAIKKYIKVEGQDAEDSYKVYLDSFPTDGRLPMDGIDLVQEMAIQEKSIDAKIPIDDLIDYTYINMFKK